MWLRTVTYPDFPDAERASRLRYTERSETGRALRRCWATGGRAGGSCRSLQGADDAVFGGAPGLRSRAGAAGAGS